MASDGFGANGVPINVSNVNASPQQIPVGVESVPVGAETIAGESTKVKHHGVFGWLFHSKKHSDSVAAEQ